ncbi:cystein dioxygenase [Moumouvirus maliensis]|nr:cystein dioxygenase [Moumouvirus maliensis]
MNTLDKLIDKLEKNFIKETDIINFIDIFREYNGDDWVSFVQFNGKYNKVLIKRTEYFELYLIFWNENQKSDIHDHPHQGCLMKILSGELQEQEYINLNGEIKPGHSNILKKDNIVYKSGNEILHQIFSPQKSVSMHLYSPPFYEYQKY